MRENNNGILMNNNEISHGICPRPHTLSSIDGKGCYCCSFQQNNVVNCRVTIQLVRMNFILSRTHFPSMNL